MKNRLIALFLFLTLSTVFISGCGKEKEAEEQKAKKQVKIQEIKLQNKVTSTLTASGTVIPKQYSVIRSLTQGTVEYITPVGTNVVIGQALFQIRDNSIENNYFNALQNHRQTSVISDERVTQAELALNSAQARLNLAEKNLETTKKQTAQGLTNVKESTIITYNSAYNALNQVFNFVSDGSANNIDFRYLNITTRNTQLHIDTKTQYLTAASIFIDLEKIPNRADLNQSLNEIYNVVSATKLLTDLNVLLLQNTIGGLKSIDSDKLIITNYQAQVNGYIDAIVASQNALRNTKINNQLMMKPF